MLKRIMNSRRTKTKAPRKPHVRSKNNLLYEQLQYTGSYHNGTRFTLVSFDASEVKRLSTDSVEELLHALSSPKINFVTVHGLSDLTKISAFCHGLGIASLWTQDIVNVMHIAKIEENDEMALAILDYFAYNDSLLEREHLAFILKNNTVVAFQESDKDYFAEIAQAIDEQSTRVRQASADYLFNLLLSRVVDSYLAILDLQRERMLDIEDALMEFSDKAVSLEKEIQVVRKEALVVKRSIMPLNENFRMLLESKLIKPTNKIYFRDSYDHLSLAIQLIDSAHSIIASLVDLYLANNDLRMNSIMSRLTVVATIFIPLTFLAGVWGMNFVNMPETQWKYGYLYAWIVMIAAAVAVVIWAKRKHWL